MSCQELPNALLSKSASVCDTHACGDNTALRFIRRLGERDKSSHIPYNYMALNHETNTDKHRFHPADVVGDKTMQPCTSYTRYGSLIE